MPAKLAFKATSLFRPRVDASAYYAYSLSSTAFTDPHTHAPRHSPDRIQHITHWRESDLRAGFPVTGPAPRSADDAQRRALCRAWAALAYQATMPCPKPSVLLAVHTMPGAQISPRSVGAASSHWWPCECMHRHTDSGPVNACPRLDT